jgi:hypothetical protein
MTKPHEEKWEAVPMLAKREPYWGIKVDAATAIGLFPETFAMQRYIDEAKEQMPDRARLIAQAPAMARLLLKLQDAAEGEHDADCELAAVLRQAGVLP